MPATITTSSGLIADWEQVRSGPFYYWWNVSTGETRWEKPQEAPGTGDTWRELDAAAGYRATRKSHGSAHLAPIEEVSTPLLSPQPERYSTVDEQRISRQMQRENTIFGASAMLATGEEDALEAEADGPEIEFANIYAEAMAETYADELVVGIEEGVASVGDDMAGDADEIAWPEASPGDAGRLSSGWKQVPQVESPLLAYAAELVGTQGVGGLLAEPPSVDATALELMREQMRPELSDAVLDALEEAEHPLATAFDPSRVTSRTSFKAAEEEFATAYNAAFDEAWGEVIASGASDRLAVWGPREWRDLES